MSGRWRVAAIGTAAAVLAGCAGKPAPAPAPPPPVRAAPQSRPEPPPPVAPEQDWRDLELSPGGWSYGEGEARFPGFSLRCEQGRITVSRGGASGPVRVRTTYGERTLPAGGALAASDPLFDEMAFSRGRFTVEAQGQPMLIIPAWAEVSRLVEDCRG
jgi:hypothetical protein